MIIISEQSSKYHFGLFRGHFYVPETGSISETTNKIKQKRERSMLTVPGTDICGPSIDQCVHKNCIIDNDAIHCYGENILIYVPKISKR